MDKYSTDENETPTLLAKWQTLMHATTDSRLSRNDICVLAQLLDYANAETWLAWPAPDTVATNIDGSARNVIRNVKNLMEYGYLELVMQGGGRNRTNRYRPKHHEYTRPAETMTRATPFTNHDTGVMENTETMTSQVENHDIPVQETMTPASPELVYELGAKRRNEVNNCEAAPGAAAPDGAPLGAEDKKEDASDGIRYPWFWESWSSRRDVFKTEQAIGTALASGVSEDAIADGVKRYSAYCQSNGKAMLIPPLKWIQERRWLDSWQAPDALPQTEVTQDVEECDDKIIVYGALAFSDAWLQYRRASEKEYRRLEKKHGFHNTDDADEQDRIISELVDPDIAKWDDKHPEPATFTDGLMRARHEDLRNHDGISVDTNTGKPIYRMEDGELVPEKIDATDYMKREEEQRIDAEFQE
ncbi:helix-turn-helix domain-containing protein [Salinisphaera orenii]|uniref:helix-turn-helix domain-containing protein n=1 Tax=Salinisphaera orenii TaxID=856731 RepID=UPI000DBE76B3